MEQLGRQRPRVENLESLFGATDTYKRKRKEEAEQKRVKVEKVFLDKFRKTRKVSRSPLHKKEEEAEERGSHGETR